MAVLTAGAVYGALATSPKRRTTAYSYQDWPTFLQDNQRSAATRDPLLTIAGVPTLQLAWKLKTGGPIATSANVVGTTAYVGSWDGNEYAVDTQTGDVIWKTFLGTTNIAGCDPPMLGITSSATIVDGVVYVGGGDSNWYALDAAKGTILWSVPTGDNSKAGGHYNWSSPLVVNGFAYIGIASNCDNPLVQGHLMKVDLSSHQVVGDHNFVPNGQTGATVWTSSTYDPATNRVFVATGALTNYTQTQSQAMVALDATTMTAVDSWQLPFEAAVNDSDWGTTPTLTTDAKGDALLSVANKNGILYTFNRSGLAAGPVWQRRIALGGECPACGDGTIASGIFAKGVLYYAGGRTVIGGHGSGGSLTAVDPGTGNVLWTHETDKPILGSPAYVNGMIALAQGSTFEIVNAANGDALYDYQLPATVYGAVSVAQSQFYVGAVDGSLYAFRLPSSTTSIPADRNCPPGFVCQDIGTRRTSKSEQTDNGVLRVTAGGAQMTGSSDQFRFISKPVTGDAQLSAKLLSQSPKSQAGLMIRQSADPTAPYYAVVVSPGARDLEIWYRSAWGSRATEATAIALVDLPRYLMIQRTGNLFTTATSTDGQNFQLVPGSTVDLVVPTTILHGVAVGAGAPATTGNASFANLSVGDRPSTTLTSSPPRDRCPQGWSCQDVGNPEPPGHTTGTNPYALDGTGTGTGETADSFNYVYQPVSSDTTLSARVVVQQAASGQGQGGLMFRASLAPTSPYYGVFINANKSALVQWRTLDGIPVKMNVPIPPATSTTYLAIIQYTDNRFTPPVTFFATQTSSDGTTWTPLLGSTVAIDMGSTRHLAGLAATSRAAGSTVPVEFSSVMLAGVSSPPPGICPTKFTCADIGGASILPGNQIYLNGTWTIQAGGGDIFSSFDQFRFAYASFPDSSSNSRNGDGTISARVLSQSGSEDSMKTGVMIRSSTGPQAPYYGVFVTPGQGVAVQWRTAQGEQTNQVLQRGLAGPLWVLASRYTDTTRGVVSYSAYTSSDGKTFAFVPGSTIALSLPQPLVSGIATDSHNSYQLATTTVDNLAELSGSNPPPG